MQVYFVRHGETDWNKNRQLQGGSDIPLNDSGIELAQITAESLKDIPFDKAISSPMIRALKTCEILIEGRDLTIETNELLRELSFGPYEGQNVEEIGKDHSHPLHNFIAAPEKYVAVNGAEPLEDFFVRCKKYLDEFLIPLEGKHQHVLIAGHGALIRAISLLVENQPMENLWSKRLNNLEVVSFLVKDGKISLTNEGQIYY